MSIGFIQKSEKIFWKSRNKVDKREPRAYNRKKAKEATPMICYDRLWKTLIDKHMNKTELRDRIGISNATLAKLGKNEPVNLKIIENICKELECGIEDVVEIHP